MGKSSQPDLYMEFDTRLRVRGMKLFFAFIVLAIVTRLALRIDVCTGRNHSIKDKKN